MDGGKNIDQFSYNYYKISCEYIRSNLVIRLMNSEINHEKSNGEIFNEIIP